MSYFNSNITGGSGSGGASGLVTKFVKTIAISSSTLAEVTIDISHDINNYKDITNDRIIVELNDASAIAAGDSKLSHTYNAETGIITITSTNSSIPFASSSAVELSVNVYVAGAVQLPVQQLKEIYTYTKENPKPNDTYPDTLNLDIKTILPDTYAQLTANNFILKINRVVAWGENGNDGSYYCSITPSIVYSDGNLTITNLSNRAGNNGDDVLLRVCDATLYVIQSK